MTTRDDMLSVMGRIRTIIKRTLNASRAIRREHLFTAPVSPFHGDMSIDEAWSHHPLAPSVFQRFHLPACDGCAVRFEETIKEAADAYGIDLDAFLYELNELRS